MKINVLNECGYEQALLGMSLSHYDGSESMADWWPKQFPKAIKRAKLLAGRDGGHNKFLESIVVWIDVTASRAWWSQFDTYRVGTTKQSTSTMHTLAKRRPVLEDFSPLTDPRVVEAFISVWDSKPPIPVLKAALPEGFLQRRVICTNYKALRNILHQREGHRLGEWKIFSDYVLYSIDHPELLVEE